MATSSEYLADIGEVKIYRRRGLKNIRLRVDGNGQIKLSLPWFVTKRAGLLFVRSKKSWLAEQLESHPKIVNDIKFVGRYKLIFTKKNIKRPQVHVEENTLFMNLPDNMSEDKEYSLINKTIEDILRKQSQHRVSERLDELAKQNDISYKTVKVKKLKSRWGSCDQHKNITLNLYLSQLPDEICDYVLFHELAHTEHLNHSAKFWLYVKKLDPDYLEHRRELKKFSPGKLNMR